MIQLQDALDYFESNKITIEGVYAGQYLHKTDFLAFVGAILPPREQERYETELKMRIDAKQRTLDADWHPNRRLVEHLLDTHKETLEKFNSLKEIRL